MPYDDDIEDRFEAEASTRCRQQADLENSNAYCTLYDRLGIRVVLGGGVRHHGEEGIIVDTAGQRLKVQSNGNAALRICYATSGMTYATPTGWIEATSVADPWATAPAEAAR